MGLAERLKSAREAIGLTQTAVCQQISIDDSSLSSFERGHREPKFAQLSALAKLYHISLSYFFDDQPVKEQTVLWRKRPENEKKIQARFLELCRQYQQLETWTKNVIDVNLPVLDSGASAFGYPQVEELANQARQVMGLGSRPGETLLSVLEETYGVKIFHLDLADKGTAACALSEEFGAAIMLNRHCSRWRRNHDLAHELFHLLTWRRYRHDQGICEPVVEEEKFATCFAGNLLLPLEAIQTSLNKAVDADGVISLSRLDGIAREFDVSLESLLWRMKDIYRWQKEQAQHYVDEAKKYVAMTPRNNPPAPKSLPERYRALAILALRRGEISLGRFAQYLNINRKEAQSYLIEGEFEDAEVRTSVA
jgi:XRE family transcriptional regulator, fatty acid utilization regulator